jgi:hypothetical protein
MRRTSQDTRNHEWTSLPIIQRNILFKDNGEVEFIVVQKPKHAKGQFRAVKALQNA